MKRHTLPYFPRTKQDKFSVNMRVMSLIICSKFREKDVVLKNSSKYTVKCEEYINNADTESVVTKV